MITAYFSYRFYYPSLFSKRAHLPHAPRIHRLDVSLPTHDRPEGDLSHYTWQSGSEAEVELLDGTVGRDDPQLLDQAWEQGPSVESGSSR